MKDFINLLDEIQNETIRNNIKPIASILEQYVGIELSINDSFLINRFSRVRLCSPIDGSPPGSPIPGILQARTLEWAAISFSNLLT